MIDWKNFSEKIEEIKSFGNISKLSNPVQIDCIYNLYKQTFGKQFRVSCDSCFADAFAVLNKLTEQKLNEMNSKEFVIRRGVILYGPTKLQNTTNHNLTNEKALWFLCSNRFWIKKFDVFPADWEKRIEGKVCGEFPVLLNAEPEYNDVKYPVIADDPNPPYVYKEEDYLSETQAEYPVKKAKKAKK